MSQESTVLGLLRLMADAEFRVAQTHGLLALLALLENAPEVSRLVIITFRIGVCVH